MSHHTHDHPEAESHDQPHSRGQGEGEGFFDKVKEFFTGSADNATREESHRDDDVMDDAATTADAPITDSVADSTESVDSSDSGWDGSEEPPESLVPDDDAVAASGGASGDDGGDSAYASRHGNGVDDSGVLADAPLEDSTERTDGERAVAVVEDSAEDSGSGFGASGDGASEVGAFHGDSDEEPGEDADPARREEEFAHEHDPSTHDVEAGEEFRQQGDWTADEHGGPQVQEPGGALHVPGDESPEGSAGDDAGRAGGDAGRAGESALDDVHDGGHGWGSAAPIEGGAMPLGHPVKAWHDTMTFVLPGEDGYEGSDPHEWFVDAEVAQNAGFRHAHGG